MRTDNAFLAKTVPLIIDGKTVESSDGRTFETIDPATEEVIARVACASADDVDAAVEAASRSFESGLWSRAPKATRKRVLLQVADVIERNADELAHLETLDTGVPISQTGGRHIFRAIDNFRYFAEFTSHDTNRLIASEDTHLNLITHEPVGVIGILSPWNAPLALSTMRIAAALSYGNSIILKPSESAPLTASRLAELVLGTDLPAGVWNVVQGLPQPTGETLVQHPRVDAVALTGGTETGKIVMKLAASTVKKLSFELGGKSASIVFADCDWDRTIDGTLLGIFSNNGQQSLAGSRILVEDSIYDEFVAEFVSRAERIRVGDPLDPKTEVGPLVSAAHYRKVMRFVEQGCSEGAAILAGGVRPAGFDRGFYLRPTVFGEGISATCVSREEIFGPVAVFKRFKTEEEAVAIANDSVFGLAGYVWTENLERAARVSTAMRTGTVWVNTPLFRDIRAPFGGIKQSGFGRDGGEYGAEFYSNIKTVCVATKRPVFPRFGSEFRL
ncbi:MAG: aldehyde dehydrogenase [Acidobacteria bacterium]|nr:aldehyde dehydrogenase [Acidobacteriota bacterium]